MRKHFSKSWKASVQPRKQRKYRYNAPLHVKHRFLSAHLSADLRKRHGKRSFPLRKGDEVLIMSGSFAKKQGKVTDINVKNGKIIIENINRTKKDGSKVPVYVDSSKLKIISLDMDDKKRMRRKTDVKSEEKNAPNKS